MDAMNTEYHLTPKQIIVRIISIIVCGVGASACAYSLTIQVAEVGAMMASFVWFAGLGAVVAALAGYTVTCDPGKKKGYVPLAAVCIFAIAGVLVVLEKMYLYDYNVIVIALIALAVQAVVLIVYHFILKAQDPDAL